MCGRKTQGLIRCVRIVVDSSYSGFQMVWVWSVSFGIIFLNSVRVPQNSTPLGALDYVGWAIGIFGWVFQLIADIHKYLFRKNPANKNVVMNKGVWYISRHPNYFGEIMLWWGVWIGTVPTFHLDVAGYATILSPVMTMLILFSVSGIMSGEGKNLRRYYNNKEMKEPYDKYFKSTPPVFPLLPVCYQCCSPTVKAVFCCDYPCYRYVEEEKEIDVEKSMEKSQVQNVSQVESMTAESSKIDRTNSIEGEQNKQTLSESLIDDTPETTQ